MPLDPRSARALLKLCKEFAEFDEIELSSGDVTVRAKRSSGPTVTRQEPARPKQKPAPRSAIDSLRDNPPLFYDS